VVLAGEQAVSVGIGQMRINLTKINLKIIEGISVLRRINGGG